jgi:hypothetical protein
MNVAQLKEIIKDLPDETPIGLVDLTTEDIDDSNYGLTPESFSVEDVINPATGEPMGKALIIFFENRLNPHPLT